MGGALGVLGVGYAGRSQRRMRRVNRSAARLSRGGIGDLRVECVKEVSGRVSFSIWGAGAPWERPPTDYLNAVTPYMYATLSALTRPLTYIDHCAVYICILYLVLSYVYRL
jgi:hypothetical protein